MLHSQPNNWKIFQIPPVQPIQYYSILKRKREFSQLIKQYDAQVPKHGYLHYCSIVPKSISSPLTDEYELLIVFLADAPSTSFIGFRVSVNSETFKQESSSLLLFLKQSKKAGLHFINNNCIHVQCGKNAWEIFYLLYGIYLRKFVLTVIGTQFVYHFVYELCFQNEKKLLNMLFRGSKVIRVSKMSIYYRIHQKRKISVTDLIHMTLNMPESKRYIVSFDSKESFSHSNVIDQNIYTAVGSKIHVSKLVINKFKKQYRLQDNRYTKEIPLKNVPSPILNFHSKTVSPEFKTHKEDIENKQLMVNNCVLKRKFEETENEFERDFFFPKISVSNCLREENNWQQYTSLKLCPVKSYSSLLPSNPDLFDNSKSSPKVDSPSNLCSNKLFPSVFLQNPIGEGICDIYNLNKDSQHDGYSITAPCREKRKLNNCKKNASTEFRPQMRHPENRSLSFSASKEIGEANADEIFTTASGKSINISNNAMLAAQRFIQGIETHLKSDRDENKQFKPAFKKYSVTSYDGVSGERDTKSTNNNYELGVSYDGSFYTASGKTINVSKAAMKAAQKLIVFENQEPSSSGTSNTHKKDICSPSKKVLNTDKSFVEKFFREENKQLKHITQSSQDFDKVSNKLTTRKIRKSLGGRRSMRFYNDT